MYSFHVGSACYDATAYSSAVVSARAVFDMAEDAGFQFNLLDIGGGFPGQASVKPSFEEVRSTRLLIDSASSLFYDFCCFIP